MDSSQAPKRMMLLSLIAAGLGLASGGAAWILLHLIAAITNLAVFGRFGFHPPSFSTLAPSPRIVIVAVVGGPETEGFVSAGVIGALGPDGVIVNIARGSVIDEEALIAALQSGAIRGAALDVFRGEPQVDPRLLAAPNLLALPHIGSATVETRAAMGQLQRANLRAILDGRAPETPVN